MLQYSEFSGTTGILKSDLSELIGYHLYGLDSFVDTFDEELCASLEVDRRVADAVHCVRTWGVHGLWREDEEWIGDALAGVVGGTGKMDSLPCKT